MKFTKLISYLFIISGMVLFHSCAEDNEHINSSLRLLPSKIVTEYEASNKYIYTYEYDDLNRLTEYKEIGLFANNIVMEDMETTCKIVYNSNNEIDSLIITPRLLDPEKSRDISGEIYSLVNDTILFEYEGQVINIKYRNKKDEQILINSRNEVTAYKYYGGADENIAITNIFEYDNKGNIIQSTISNSTSSSNIPSTYIYDRRNGAFKNVNAPQWFLVIMLNTEFNLSNNYQQYTDYEGNKWIMEYEYNNDDYPIHRTTLFEGKSKMKVSEAPTKIEYISAK